MVDYRAMVRYDGFREMNVESSKADGRQDDTIVIRAYDSSG
jgi:hypothetical protein